jgi:hypothetical protein
LDKLGEHDRDEDAGDVDGNADRQQKKIVSDDWPDEDARQKRGEKEKRGKHAEADAEELPSEFEAGSRRGLKYKHLNLRMT